MARRLALRATSARPARPALLLALLLATSLAALLVPAARADLQDGINAMGRGNYPRAVEIFEPMALEGDWNAQGFLAHTYLLMEENREAYAWFYATARCGSVDAKIELEMLTPKLTAETVKAGEELGEIYFDRYCR